MHDSARERLYPSWSADRGCCEIVSEGDRVTTMSKFIQSHRGGMCRGFYSGQEVVGLSMGSVHLIKVIGGNTIIS